MNSVTVFAKCHHGHLYFPTKHPARHPHLKKGLDLCGQQVKALHTIGIRAPIYISVQCDEFAAKMHPDWVALHPDGRTVGRNQLDSGWYTLDLSSPYQDYLAEQVAEILKRYKPVDGIFFDMCWDQPSLSRYAVEKMLAAGYDPENEADRKTYAHEVALAFEKRFHALVRRSAPGASVYFNSRPLTFLKDDCPFLTHVEIECLPTGGWGYMYFPLNVRYARTFDKPYLGMTARFHKSWADFGGIKPYAALKYEVCQMLAHGAQCSIGDQLHPRGVLEAPAYDLIGRVYGYAESCEPWTTGAKPVTEIGIFRSEAAGSYRSEPGGSDDGATRLLTQLKHQFDVVTTGSSMDKYRLLILPDSVAVDATLAGRLRAFLKKGGSLLLSGTSGLDGNLRPVLPQMGIRVAGQSPFQTTYLRFGSEIGRNVPPMDHVMYERGLRISPARGAEALARVVEPYFDRNYLHYSSHNQTPPLMKPSRYAAAVRNGQVITIAFPIFKAFGTHGSLPYRALVQNCIDLLMPAPLVQTEAPSTTELTVMRQGRRLVVHILQFVAERRTNIDMVEDIVPLYNMTISVRFARKPGKVYLAPTGQRLDGALPIADVIRAAAALVPPEPEELPRDSLRLPGGAGNTTRGEGVRRGKITCSVRVWMQPRVKVGSRYQMEDGAIVVDSLAQIELKDITPELARESGFSGVEVVEMG